MNPFDVDLLHDCMQSGRTQVRSTILVAAEGNVATDCGERQPAARGGSSGWLGISGGASCACVTAGAWAHVTRRRRLCGVREGFAAELWLLLVGDEGVPDVGLAWRFGV